MTADDLEPATALAHEAGEILLRHWRARDRLTICAKRAGDFLSDADLDAETHLRALGGGPPRRWLARRGKRRGA